MGMVFMPVRYLNPSLLEINGVALAMKKGYPTEQSTNRTDDIGTIEVGCGDLVQHRSKKKRLSWLIRVTSWSAPRANARSNSNAAYIPPNPPPTISTHGLLSGMYPH